MQVNTRKLSDSLLSIVNRQLVDLLESGSAVSITEEDRIRTTQSKTTNLSAEHFVGDLDNDIRRKRNASLRRHSGVIMLKRNKTVEWLKQKTKKSPEIVIKDEKTKTNIKKRRTIKRQNRKIKKKENYTSN